MNKQTQDDLKEILGKLEAEVHFSSYEAGKEDGNALPVDDTEYVDAILKLIEEEKESERKAIIKAYKQATGIKNDIFIRAISKKYE